MVSWTSTANDSLTAFYVAYKYFSQPRDVSQCLNKRNSVALKMLFKSVWQQATHNYLHIHSPGGTFSIWQFHFKELWFCARSDYHELRPLEFKVNRTRLKRREAHANFDVNNNTSSACPRTDYYREGRSQSRWLCRWDTWCCVGRWGTQMSAEPPASLTLNSFCQSTATSSSSSSSSEFIWTGLN